MTVIFMGALCFDLVMKVAPKDSTNPDATLSEYRKIGPFLGSFMFTFRLSLGDFAFDLVDDDIMTQSNQQIFWGIWLFLVVLSLLIMLNFIIAEVSNSYEIIRSQLQAYIYKERAGMCAEAEGILSEKQKSRNVNWFPNYIICRDRDE